jgi:hypothetical protein
LAPEAFVAQVSRQAILQYSTLEKKKKRQKKLGKIKLNTLDQYCLQHCSMCKPAHWCSSIRAKSIKLFTPIYAYISI